MASVRGTRRTRSRTPVVEDIVPNSGWTEDSIGHYLLVDLPEFRKEEVKFDVDGSGRIVVRGERQANEQKRVRFELTFPVPADSDVDKIAGNLEGEILYVIVPKRISQPSHSQESKETKTQKEAANDSNHVERSEEIQQEEPNADHGEGTQRRYPSQHEYSQDERRSNENAHIGGFPEELVKKWEQEPNMSLRSVMKVLWRNKGIVVTAVVAFSFGLYVSRKFQSSIEP